MRHHLPAAHVDSAGTAGWHKGKPPHDESIAAAHAHGIDLSAQRARQVVPADFARFGLILAMDRGILADLRDLDTGKGARLDMFLAPLGGGDVPDPYYTGDFEGVFTLIDRAARAWADRLS